MKTDAMAACGSDLESTDVRTHDGRANARTVGNHEVAFVPWVGVQCDAEVLSRPGSGPVRSLNGLD